MVPAFYMMLGRTGHTDPDTSDEKVREGRKRFREECGSVIASARVPVSGL
jgi:hypothetical protein